MKPEFETIEEFSVDSELADTNVKVRLRRQINHNPTRFSPAPYFLDLKVGSLHRSLYAITEHSARDAMTRFLLEHVKGIAPPLH